MKREENQHRQPLQPIECLHKIVTRTSARSNVSVIPARVSGAREESRIPLEDGGEGPGFFARQPRARMTEQEIEQDRSRRYLLPDSIEGWVHAGNVRRARGNVWASEPACGWARNPAPLLHRVPCKKNGGSDQPSRGGGSTIAA